MRVRRNSSQGKYLGRGAISGVISVYAAVTRPSTVASHQVKKRKHVVVLKKSTVRLFLPDGKHNDTDAIRGFILEIRILSHKALRDHPNIIKLLGVHWDCETGYPEPLLLLEKASTDLADFQSRHQRLPFDTKKSIALDIACGLAALHQCGIVHGDLKPQNVLIFTKPLPHAKVADFSHSVLDTGETRRLVGGTWLYSAPEWEKAASTANLLKSDVYSYGLVFAGLILGHDIEECIQRNPLVDLNAPIRQVIQTLKEEDQMEPYLLRQLHFADQNSLDSDFGEFLLIKRVWKATVQLDAEKRSLRQVLHLLGGHERQSLHKMQRVEAAMAADAISIPYHVLENLDPVLMDRTVSALTTTAASSGDSRRAAAWIELAICHASGIARFCGSDFNVPSWRTSALSALLHAAELGDPWARAVVHRFSQALGEPIAARYNHEEWLFDAAKKGSSIAFQSLVELNPVLAVEALCIYRTTFCGNPEKLYLDFRPTPKYMDDLGTVINARGDTVLHWIASIGNTATLRTLAAPTLDQVLINGRNEQGDSPLICAARAGHFDMLRALIDQGADASLCNAFSENPLHFLSNLDVGDIPEGAKALVNAGAEVTAEAVGYSGNAYLDSRPRGKSCPLLRAIFANNSVALRSLLSVTLDVDTEEAAYELIPLSAQRSMLAWALRLHCVDILDVLAQFLKESRLFTSLGKTYLWNNGRRYSLPELCILGYMSSNPSSGINIPEPVFRILNHGRDYKNSLDASLRFLACHEPTILAQPCNGSRNALFFAIKEGRTDAASCLASLRPWTEEGSLFNAPTNRWKWCQEIRSLMYNTATKDDSGTSRVPVSKREKLRKMLSGARRGGRSPIFGWPSSEEELNAINAPPEDDYDNPDDDSIFDSGSELEETTCQHARRYSMYGEHYSHDAAAAQPYHLEHHQPFGLSVEDRIAGNALAPGTERLSPLPTNFHQMEGVTDAVLMSIFYGKRSVLHMLLTGMAKATIREQEPFPCFANKGAECRTHYNDSIAKATAHSHDADNLVSHFPVKVWENCVSIGNRDPEIFEPFDGIIRYSLMYMTAIATSGRPDIQLARILIAVMKHNQIPYPRGWAPGSTFESACLSLTDTVGRPPLFYAALRKWDRMVALLIEHGASPQAISQQSHVETNVVGSQAEVDITVMHDLHLCTQDGDGEVQRLLALASQFKAESIITIRDVDRLLSNYPHSRRDDGLSFNDLVQWDRCDRGLCWPGYYYESPPAAYLKLWEDISVADRAQERKMRLTMGGDRRRFASAVERRDLVAIQHLLNLDPRLDINSYPDTVDGNQNCEKRSILDRLFFFRLRTTCLDMVSWSSTVESSRCSETGLRLQAHDKRIAAFLVSRGAVRGPSYSFPALLARVLIQIFFVPFVATPLQGYVLYLSGTWAMAAVPNAYDETEAALAQNEALKNIGRSLCTAQLVLSCVISVCFPAWFTVLRRTRNSWRGWCTIVVLSAITVSLLTIVVVVSVMGTGSQAGRLFGVNSAALVSVQLCVACGYGLLSLVCLSFVYLTQGHLRSLSNFVQCSSPYKYVWRATKAESRGRSGIKLVQLPSRQIDDIRDRYSELESL